MLTVPFYAVLFLYFFFLLGFVTLVLINLGHLVSTGTFTMLSFVITFLFLSYSIIVLGLTWAQLLSVDWQQPVTIWNSDWISYFTSFGKQPF